MSSYNVLNEEAAPATSEHVFFHRFKYRPIRTDRNLRVGLDTGLDQDAEDYSLLYINDDGEAFADDRIVQWHLTKGGTGLYIVFRSPVAGTFRVSYEYDHEG